MNVLDLPTLLFAALLGTGIYLIVEPVHICMSFEADRVLRMDRVMECIDGR